MVFIIILGEWRRKKEFLKNENNDIIFQREKDYGFFFTITLKQNGSKLGKSQAGPQANSLKEFMGCVVDIISGCTGKYGLKEFNV